MDAAKSMLLSCGAVSSADPTVPGIYRAKNLVQSNAIDDWNNTWAFTNGGTGSSLFYANRYGLPGVREQIGGASYNAANYSYISRHFTITYLYDPVHVTYKLRYISGHFGPRSENLNMHLFRYWYWHANGYWSVWLYSDMIRIQTTLLGDQEVPWPDGFDINDWMGDDLYITISAFSTSSGQGAQISNIYISNISRNRSLVVPVNKPCFVSFSQTGGHIVSSIYSRENTTPYVPFNVELDMTFIGNEVEYIASPVLEDFSTYTLVGGNVSTPVVSGDNNEILTAIGWDGYGNGYFYKDYTSRGGAVTGNNWHINWEVTLWDAVNDALAYMIELGNSLNAAALSVSNFVLHEYYGSSNRGKIRTYLGQGSFVTLPAMGQKVYMSMIKAYPQEIQILAFSDPERLNLIGGYTYWSGAFVTTHNILHVLHGYGGSPTGSRLSLKIENLSIFHNPTL